MSSTLSQLKKKQEQLAARIQTLEAAEKTRERKKDVRRKILLGALVLERLGQGDPRAESLKAELGGYLTRDNDRALFELPPMSKAESTKATEKALAETA
jgi:large subunit ribosomal protein L7/L12